MRTKTFFLSLLVMASVVMVIFAVFSSFQHVDADSREVTFVLHKRVYQNRKNIPIIQGNVQLQENSPQLKNSKGVTGAVYNAYNVSADYWQLVDEGKTNEEILITLKENADSLTTEAKKVAEVVTANDPTFGEGVATFNLPERVTLSGQEKYAVYLFKEKNSLSSEELEQSGVFIVSLPISEEQSFIHLYPKSTIRNQVELTKKMNEKKKNFTYGEPIEYVIETTIPTNTLYLSKYTLLDTYDAPLNYVPGSLRIFINDIEKKDIFTFIENIKNKELTLEATGNLLREKGITAGSKVRIVYQMILLESAIPDVPYDNSVRLSTFFEGSELPEIISEATPVETGGKNFIKVDMNDQTKGLAQATFLIKNSEDRYLVEQEGSFQWSNEKNDAYQLISDVNGKFSIKGIGYGNYKLVEIKAPVGYQLLDKEIPFTVESGSYQLGDQPTSPLMIVNAKETSESEEPKKTTGFDLPKMGGVVSTSIITTGSILFCITGVYLVRRRKR